MASLAGELVVAEGALLRGAVGVHKFAVPVAPVVFEHAHVVVAGGENEAAVAIQFIVLVEALLDLRVAEDGSGDAFELRCSFLELPVLCGILELLLAVLCVGAGEADVPSRLLEDLLDGQGPELLPLL